MMRLTHVTVRAARAVGIALALGLGTAGARGVHAQERVLDDFESAAAWTAHPADGVRLTISSDSGRRGRGLRLDFDFQGSGGYAIARAAIPLRLGQNYELAFWMRADAPVNHLELKLVDPSGDNVWWMNRRDFEFPRTWTRIATKKRQISFAWGPKGGGDPDSIAAIELAITAGAGGKGTVWLDDLTLRALPPVTPYDLTPRLRASSARAGQGAARALDGDMRSAWRSGAGGAQSLSIDFGKMRELGGLTIDWGDAYATRYALLVSPDGSRWDTAYVVDGGDGGRDYLYLPETETRHLRLALSGGAGGRGYAIREIGVQPLEWSASMNDFLAAVARDAPVGWHPKYFTGVQSYWTVIGVAGDPSEGMINEEGMVETGKAGFSIEPFLHDGDSLITWRDVRTEQTLEGGSLPIPTVRWLGAPLELATTAFASGEPGASTLHVRYAVRNTTAARRRASLLLALRPLQVNPPWQFLNTTGGWARVRELAYDGRIVQADGGRTVVPVSAPAGFGAATFDGGGIIPAVARDTLPARTEAVDRLGLASGALRYSLDLAPGQTREVHVAVPLHASAPAAPVNLPHDSAAAWGSARLVETTRRWERMLGAVALRLPHDSARIAETLRSTLAYIHINRDGPAIQPGSRSYERSWIRDGALTSAALLRLGHEDAVREFIEWYAPYQYENGKVPCCVDASGAGPVPEHDSHGQLIFLIMEHHRYVRDTAFLARMWPHIAGAVAYMDSLRGSRRTDEYLAPEKRAYFGLMPQSISHEGYSAKPMHSFWDDAFALRGLKDAAEAARILGKRDTAVFFAGMRDEFRDDMMTAYRLTMETHGIDWLAGAVELGDFDATSTTVGLAPGGEQHRLPQAALARTFDKYWEEFVARRDGRKDWDAYTPYELRVVGTFVRLGQRDRAHGALAWFLEDRRPLAWNHWAEVVWRDSTAPKFIGDMPHTWVGSDFIRSVTDMFAYEEERDSSLVVGAGVIEPWLRDDGVELRDLRTHYGMLDVAMRAEGPNAVRVRLTGALRIPPGGVVLRSPLDRPIRAAEVDGRPAAASGDALVLRALPADVLLRY